MFQPPDARRIATIFLRLLDRLEPEHVLRGEELARSKTYDRGSEITRDGFSFPLGLGCEYDVVLAGRMAQGGEVLESARAHISRLTLQLVQNLLPFRIAHDYRTAAWMQGPSVFYTRAIPYCDFTKEQLDANIIPTEDITWRVVRDASFLAEGTWLHVDQRGGAKLEDRWAPGQTLQCECEGFRTVGEEVYLKYRVPAGGMVHCVRGASTLHADLYDRPIKGAFVRVHARSIYELVGKMHEVARQ